MMNTYRYAIPVNVENIEILQKYIDEKNLKIKLDESVKEVAIVSNGALAYFLKFEIVYYNGNVQNFNIEELGNRDLSRYITENSSNSNDLSIWMLLFIVSIINSVYWICNNGKNQRKIYDS